MKHIATFVAVWLAVLPAGTTYADSSRNDNGRGEAARAKAPHAESPAKPASSPRAPDLDFAADEGGDAARVQEASRQPVWLYWTLGAGAAAVVGGGVWYWRPQPAKTTAAPVKNVQVFTDG